MQKYGIENRKIMDSNFDLDQWYLEEMYNKTISGVTYDVGVVGMKDERGEGDHCVKIYLRSGVIRY